MGEAYTSINRLRVWQATLRFVCSAASLSSHSNTSLKLRGRSRTSSAAGDSLAVNRNYPENDILKELKPKFRSAKYNMRLLSSSHRNLKKFNKNKKNLKPPVSCFQNAIVIAPFYTLKKCFQTKLINLYSMEKMKNLNHKMRMAKKQNMSFEYDVLELDKVKVQVKTEKGRKATATSKIQKEKSSSYCQCDRTSKERSTKETAPAAEPPSFSKAGGKRRRLNSSVFTPTILKAEIDPRMISYNPIESFRKSDISVARSGDSWESLSNSPSQGGELLEGAIAISTTSFDSCLEQFDKESCSYYSAKNYSHQKRPREERMDAGYIPQPTGGSRHLIMSDGAKGSDGNIVDFMDREPQTQNISMEFEKHLKPLKRPSKSKIKKPEATTAQYCLRSKSLSKEKFALEQAEMQANLESRGSNNNNFIKKANAQIEVATQVESGVSEEANLKEDEQPQKNFVPELETKPAGKSDKIETEKIDVIEVMGPTLPEDSNDPIDIDLLPRVEPDTIMPSKEASEPQESDFIFGSGNTASRLGESCEFPFGLNWIFSDDEASEHGDQFY